MSSCYLDKNRIKYIVIVSGRKEGQICLELCWDLYIKSCTLLQLCKVSPFIFYFREKECVRTRLCVCARACMHMSGGGAEKERESQAGPMLRTQPDSGLNPTTLGSWPELKSRVRHSGVPGGLSRLKVRLRLRS